MVLAALLTTGFQITAGRIEAQVAVRTRAGEVSGPVGDSAVMLLPFEAGHVAVRWAGNPHAEVSVATSVDRMNFGVATDVGRNETGSKRATA